MINNFVQPEVVASHFHIRSGDKVGDFGAGSGHFLPVLSKLTGSEGKVYAVEIQKNLTEALSEKVNREHIGHVEVIWGDLEELGGTKIEDESLDVVLVSNTLFQIENREEFIKEVSRTLRSGGKLFIIDWTESFGGIGPQPTNIIDESSVKALCETAGFTFERDFPAGAHHYGLAFRK